MSPLLDPTRTEKSARTRIDTKTRGAFRGTDGSNPVPSAGESNANLTSAGAPRIVRGANLGSKLCDVLLPSVCRAGPHSQRRMMMALEALD